MILQCSHPCQPAKFSFYLKEIIFRVMKNLRSYCTGLKFAVTYQENTSTVIILNFRTDRSGQTEEQSDQGLHCLLFHLHLFGKIP